MPGFIDRVAAEEEVDFEVVREYLAQENVNINQRNKRRSAFHWICEKGHMEAANLLLSREELQINMKDKKVRNQGIRAKIHLITDCKGVTALHCACRRGHIELVKLLLSRDDLIINAKDKSVRNKKIGKLKIKTFIKGETALCGAYEERKFEIMKLFISRDDWEVNTMLKGNTPLFSACEEKQIETVKLLSLREDLDVDIKGKGITPFYFACRNGLVEIAKLLIVRKEAKVNEQDRVFEIIYLLLLMYLYKCSMLESCKIRYSNINDEMEAALPILPLKRDSTHLRKNNPKK